MKKWFFALLVLASLFNLSGCGSTSQTYIVTVSGSINSSVRAGHFDRIGGDNDISDRNFQADAPHQVGIVLRHFGKRMSTDKVLKALDAEDLRPATMSELLALGSQRPYLQKRFPIIELGSVWQVRPGHGDVGYLGHDGGMRILDTACLTDDAWIGRCRFAGVRK